MKFLRLLKFLFIKKVLKENSLHFNGFPMVLQWAQRQQFLKFKFNFKFIYSHLFNYRDRAEGGAGGALAPPTFLQE